MIINEISTESPGMNVSYAVTTFAVEILPSAPPESDVESAEVKLAEEFAEIT